VTETSSVPDQSQVDETRDLKPDENRKERVDRELIELLNELRVALPGVQVLFAFLLILPFQQGFSELEDLARHVYFAALVASALGSALLIAPSVYHRLNFRRRSKEQMLHDSNQLAIVGTAFVALGIACAIFLITDVVYGPGPAVVAIVVTLLVYGGLWWGLPLYRRRQPDDEPDED
jgi:Flp pilus assembly protein TadB